MQHGVYDEGFARERACHLVNKRAVVVVRLREDAEMPEEHAAYKVRRLIPAIDAALERIRVGTYGICASCGDPIPRARLLRLPESARCVPCQGEVDRGCA